MVTSTSSNYPAWNKQNARSKQNGSKTELLNSLGRPSLVNDFIFVLEQTGQSLLTPSAYDTAWVARVTKPANGAEEARQLVFPEALHWLITAQHEDGSWGEGGPLERVLATLAAVIALQEHLAGTTEQAGLQAQIEYGLAYLWQAVASFSTFLDNEPGDAETPVLPVGFELLFSSLIEEAVELELAVPYQLAACFETYRQKKLGLLARLKPAHLAQSSAVFSLEFYGKKLPAQAELFVHPVHGSLGGSPSATAATLRFVTDPAVRERMITFLKNNRQMTKKQTGALSFSPRLSDAAKNSADSSVATQNRYPQAQGAWPTVTGIDVFEWLWVLYNLRLCMPGVLDTAKNKRKVAWLESGLAGNSNMLSLDSLAAQKAINELVEECLTQIATHWSEQAGLPVSTAFIRDSDDTAMGFILLKEAGLDKTHKITPAALDPYWRRDEEGNELYLVTYPLERDPSTSANIHGLEAYALAGDQLRVEKLLTFLRNGRVPAPKGGVYQPYWQDKWHISPYYPTSHALMVYCKYGFDLDIVEESISWLLNTQHSDGGWGWEEESTLEETAYVFQTLLTYENYSKSAKINQENNNFRDSIVQENLAESLKAAAIFLRNHYRPFSWETHPLWVGKNRYSPLLVVRSAVLAALLLADEYKL